ncbi:YkvA family protein [Caminibacter sp.]
MTEKEKQKALKLVENLKDSFKEEEVESFFEKFKNLSFINDMKLLFEMITDKKYSLSAATYATIAGVLAYVVLPFDVIPDFLSGIGFIDDAFVISFVIKQLKDEIENYKRFKNAKKY